MLTISFLTVSIFGASSVLLVFQTLQITKQLQQSFKELLNATVWLDNSTKQLAELKIDAMHLRIGYPDFILDPTELAGRYADVNMHPDYYFENMLSILRVLALLLRMVWQLIILLLISAFN